MNVTYLADILKAEIIHLETDTALTGGYAGDFLSNVIGKAPSGAPWFTVMSNVNVAGVASLAEVGCIVLCEGTEPELLLKQKAKTAGINLIKTDFSVFDAVRIYTKCEANEQ